MTGKDTDRGFRNFSIIPLILEEMRCHQWIKNLFIFAAPVFAKQITDSTKAILAGEAFLSFCLGASSIYILNDLIDLKQDRLHPRKCRRPLASGRLSPGIGVGLTLVLGGGSLGLAFGALPLPAGIILLLYLVQNLLYSFYIKHMVILDVMFIALGFLLRVLMGAVATHVAPSYWLLLCTVNVSLFLGFTKRRAELEVLEQEAKNHRKVLEHYSHAFLDQMVAIVTGTTLVCYILYTVDERTEAVFGTRYLIATVPFVLYGIFRYLYLGYHVNEGGSPTRAILKDIPFLVNMFLWMLSCLVIIYFGSHLARLFPWE